MQQQSEGRKIHGVAEHAREGGEARFALSLLNEAMRMYSKENDDLGFAEAITSGVLSLRHLAQEADDVRYLIFAKHWAEAAVEIAEKSGQKDALALPYQRLGSVNAELEEWGKAAENFGKAVQFMQSNPPKPHDRPAVLADMKVHLSFAEYMNGDKTARERLDHAAEEVKDSDEATYNKDVWYSGALMKKAEMLHEDDPQASQEALQNAKEIIDGNSDLKKRREQWEKLNARLGA